MLNKTVAYLLFFALLATAVWFFILAPVFDKGGIPMQGAVHNASAPSGPSAASEVHDDSDKQLNFALEQISLSQGEGGFELWRLNATWANTRREDGKIIVEQPRLTYFMKEDHETPLFVRSERGDVDQKGQVMRFIENVHVFQESKTITGPLLIYNGSDKTMTFPHGGDFNDAGSSGTAKHVVWHIDDKLIDASEDVVMHFGLQSAPPDANGISRE